MFFIFSAENARPRSILNDMIAEAHSIREDIVDRQMSNTLQARQHQVHPEETVSKCSVHGNDLPITIIDLFR